MSCGGSVKSVVSSSSSTQSSNQSALQSSIGKNSLYTGKISFSIYHIPLKLDRSMSALAMEKQQIEAQVYFLHYRYLNATK